MRISFPSSQIAVADDLYLRLASPDDAFSLYQLIDTHRSYLREWLPFVDFSVSALDTKAYLRAVTDRKNDSEEVYVILYQQDIAGIVGFKGIDMVNRAAEMGYWLSGDLQGLGLMRRSCKALLQHAFGKMGLHRIQIKTGVGNLRSSNIPQKLGFTLEGVQRDGEYLNGRFHDLEVYSLLQPEFLAE
ncbi:GNAT family N-acetyltransferase [Pontibacter sp. E15-1]|uniref:GNAT family N-acetyltransferase n=1 Tax=Pontibacter sp. E15-1 TaxID=2919918 RepID=UPI001F500052|nr:GNAT family N-acetyltransferase [Pontibacter sp. E15-1]MCJ8164492.1 GNAT family N-acetyltransferase [Pontibacter sp. E15-1]